MADLQIETMTDPDAETPPIRTITIHGLRVVKRMIGDMQAAMAADPAQRRNQDPYIRGQRATLAHLSAQIAAQIAQIKDSVKNGTN